MDVSLTTSLKMFPNAKKDICFSEVEELTGTSALRTTLLYTEGHSSCVRARDVYLYDYSQRAATIQTLNTQP